MCARAGNVLEIARRPKTRASDPTFGHAIICSVSNELFSGSGGLRGSSGRLFLFGVAWLAACAPELGGTGQGLDNVHEPSGDGDADDDSTNPDAAFHVGDD